MNSFIKKVQRGHIQHPTQQKFRLDKWQLGYSGIANPSTADTDLFNSGIYIHSKLERIREEAQKIPLEATSPKLRLLLLCACANIFEQNLKEKEAGIITKGKSIDELTHTTLPTISDQSPRRVDTVLATLIDGMRTPMRVAIRELDKGKDWTDSPSFGQVDIGIRKIMILGQLYDFYEAIWMECLWNGWLLGEYDGARVATPPVVESNDPTKSKHANIAVAQYRWLYQEIQASIMSNEIWNRSTEYSKRKIANKFPEVFRVAPPSNGQLDVERLLAIPDSTPPLYCDIYYLRNTYHRLFLDMGIDNCENITLNIILDAWLVLHGIAMLLRSELPIQGSINSTDHFLRFASKIQRCDIVRLLSKWLKKPSRQIDAIINFFTMSANSDSDPWSAPLISIGSDEYVLLLTPILRGNISRTVELWRKRAKLNPAKKGKEFESFVRTQLIDAISMSEMLSTSFVYSKSLTLSTSEQDEEIDLAIIIGKTILIGEVKCLAMPVDPLNIHDYYADLEFAADQAKSKAKYVSDNVELFMKTIRYSSKFPGCDYTILPIVITSTVFGVGYLEYDVPIAEPHVLAYCLSHSRFPLSRYLVTEQVIHDVEIYSDVDSAGRAIWDFLLTPLFISRLKSHCKIKMVPIPSISETDPQTYYAFVEVDMNQGNADVE